jgi:hypothetical protein
MFTCWFAIQRPVMTPADGNESWPKYPDMNISNRTLK